MRAIVRRIMTLSKQIPQMGDMIQTRGNLDFIEILNSYPAFVEGVKGFEKKKRGRPTSNPFPNEVEYLVSLVEGLYVENGKDYTRDDRRRLKELLNRAVDGADFFDPIRSKHWIDMFSALDRKLHLFTQEESDSFEDFYANYISFYGKLNNKKMVPFYARWIKEIAAMYTIYLHESFDEFEKIREKLQEALEKGMLKKTSPRLLRYQTETVRDYMMTNIFVAYGKDKDTVLSKLCEYITDNPGEFVYETGELNSRYRRYYCTIKEMLEWIKRQKTFSFADDSLLNIYLADHVDYDLKDQRVRELEASLVSELLKLSQKRDDLYLTTDEEKQVLTFIVKEHTMYDENTHTEIVSEMNEYPFERRRSIEEVVDSIVKLLRFSIMLVVMDQALNEYETPEMEDVVNTINQIMKSLGLLSLPTHTVNSYNDKSFMDFCVIKCIEETFYEED